MTGYKMNFATKTLTITKAFAAKAMQPESDEARIMLHMKTLCPDLHVFYKENHSARKHPYKGLTYDRMERYIRLHKNADELIIAFSAVKELGRAQTNAHNYVAHWFLETFPDYYETPLLQDGKLPTVLLNRIPEDSEIHIDKLSA